MTADQSAAQSGDRKLTDAERNHILDQTVDAARDRPEKNRAGRTFLFLASRRSTAPLSRPKWYGERPLQIR